MNAPRKFFLPGALLLAAACASAPRPAAPAVRADRVWDAPPIERCVSLRAADGRALEFDGLLDDLAAAEVVFLGETHLDETTHRFELAVLEGLLARRPGEVVLALEMFERDVQPLVDRYLAGEVGEAEFLAGSRPWNNYRTGYRPLVEAARRAGAPVVAANFPAPLRRELAMSRAADLAGLSAEQRAFAPAELLPNGALYWKRVDNAIRGHAAAMGLPETTPEARLMSTQSLWDNAMGEACAQALERWPGRVVLHVNGGFHTAYGDGTARQLLLRRPGTDVRTVAIQPVANPASAGLYGLPEGDYVAFVEARAADVSGGKQEVALPRTLQYRLHVPDDADGRGPLPLLVWLSEDGLEAQDGLDLWTSRLGGDCLIASLDAPYRERQPDGGSGRRWFWRDTFAEDVGGSVGAIARAIGYVARHHAVDPARIVVAGEGAGATVAVRAALVLDEAPISAVAWEPHGLRGLSDLPLPLPELRGDLPPRETRLSIVAPLGEAADWAREVDAYQSIGVDVQATESHPYSQVAELEEENALRLALGIVPRTLPEDAARLHVVVSSVRERQWARVAAARAEPDSHVATFWGGVPTHTISRALDLQVTPQDIRDGAELPRAPGSFGGTTVLVIPPGLDEAHREAWIALEADDPIAAKSRFSRLRVAELDLEAERFLPRMLMRQVEEGRRNVLVVPAVFHGERGMLEEIREACSNFEDRLDLAYRAGLGGL
ncbi:MAG TPA: ChaN family lipoprotein [Planctomycetota bacterium]|nr:ChaN family lipoprotein [Planctomycetota bacterium]